MTDIAYVGLDGEPKVIVVSDDVETQYRRTFGERAEAVVITVGDVLTQHSGFSISRRLIRDRVATEQVQPTEPPLATIDHAAAPERPAPWKRREHRAPLLTKPFTKPADYRVTHATLSDGERAYLRPGTSARRRAKWLARQAM